MTLVKSNGNGKTLPKLINDFFETDFFSRPGFLDFNMDFPFNRLSTSMPSANIIEMDGEYKLEMAAPGLEKKDFKIEVDNGLLTISSEKKEEKKEEKKNYRRQEFSYQSFSRSFRLPENSVSDKIDAHYENGLLTLTLPKKEKTPTKAKKEIKID